MFLVVLLLFSEQREGFYKQWREIRGEIITRSSSFGVYESENGLLTSIKHTN